MSDKTQTTTVTKVKKTTKGPKKKKTTTIKKTTTTRKKSKSSVPPKTRSKRKTKGIKKKPTTVPNIIINEGPGGMAPGYPPPPYPYYYPQPPYPNPYGMLPEQELRAEQSGSITAPVDNKVQGDDTKPKEGDDADKDKKDDDTKPDDKDKKDDDKKKKKDPHKWRNRFLIMIVFVLIGVVITNAANSGSGGGGLFGVSAETPCNQRGSNETTCLNGINCAWYKDSCVNIDCKNFSSDAGFCNNNTSNQCMYLDNKCRAKVCSQVKKEGPCNDIPSCGWNGGECLSVTESTHWTQSVGYILIGTTIFFIIIIGVLEYRARQRAGATRQEDDDEPLPDF